MLQAKWGIGHFRECLGNLGIAQPAGQFGNCLGNLGIAWLSWQFVNSFNSFKRVMIIKKSVS